MVQKSCEEKVELKIELNRRREGRGREKSLHHYGDSFAIIHDVFGSRNFLSVNRSSIYFSQTDAQTFFDADGDGVLVAGLPRPDKLVAASDCDITFSAKFTIIP